MGVMSPEAKKARALYMREWRKRNPEKQREYTAKQWEHKAEYAKRKREKEKEEAIMGKYRIKEASKGWFIVLYLKDMGGGYSWEQIGRKYATREEAQAFIDAERARRNEQEG